MVIDIYGTKEVFVNEYRTLLADRLLTQLDFNPEKEIRNLELLKLRFGESLLHTCEVMLKDISDSKRINLHIGNESNMQTEEGKTITESNHCELNSLQNTQIDRNFSETPFELSSLVLSSQFWPVFKNDTLELPETIKHVFDKFTKSYETYKGNRTLCWRPFIGRVDLDIEMGNKTFSMTVSPVLAVIIHSFQEQSKFYIPMSLRYS